MAIQVEQWRPHVRPSPDMPMGPYRRGDVPTEPNWAHISNAIQKSWRDASIPIGRMAKMIEAEKSLKVKFMDEYFNNVAKGQNEVIPTTISEARATYPEFMEDGVTKHERAGQPKDYVDMTRHEKKKLNKQIESLGAYKQQIKKLITEFGTEQTLNEDNIDYNALIDNSDVAAFLSSLGIEIELDDDGKPIGDLPWGFDFEGGYNETWDEIMGKKGGKAKRQAKRSYKNQTEVPRIWYRDQDNKKHYVTLGQLHAASGMFKDNVDKKDTITTDITASSKELTAEIKAWKNREGHPEGISIPQQDIFKAEGARKKAQGIIGQFGGAWIYSNMLPVGKDGKLAKINEDGTFDWENSKTSGRYKVKYDPTIHAKMVEDYLTQVISNGAMTPRQQEVKEPIKETKEDPPSKYPKTVISQVSEQFGGIPTIAQLSATDTKTGEIIGVTSNEGGLVGKRIQTSDGIKFIEQYNIKQGDNGEVLLTLSYRGTGIIKGGKIYEEVTDSDGTITQVPVMVDILDKDGKATGKKRQATLADQDEAFDMPTFDLTKPNDVKELYDALGIQSDARKDDYLDEGGGWSIARTNFILNDGNIESIIANDMHKKVKGEDVGTNHESWQNIINSSPYYTEQVKNRLENISKSKVLTAKESAYLTKLLVLNKRYKDLAAKKKK